MIIFTAITISCSTPQVNNSSSSISFTVLSNTLPNSPFKGYSQGLPKVISSMNKQNPDIILYLGNIVRGGESSVGVYAKDLTRQFEEFNKSNKSIPSAIYTVLGQWDLFNNSSQIYTKMTGKKLNYSFAFGDSHFFIINNINTNENVSLDEKLKWFKNELESINPSSPIFIISHFSMLNSRLKLTKIGEKIHNTSREKNVIAFISGEAYNYKRTKIDGVEFLNFVTKGFTKKERFTSRERFFEINYKNRKLTIIPHKK